MGRRTRSGIVFTAAITLVFAVGAHAAGPRWNCRASVARIQLLMPIEPLIANGLPGGGPRPSCAPDNTTLPSVDLPGIRAELLSAKTERRPRARAAAATVSVAVRGVVVSAE